MLCADRKELRDVLQPVRSTNEVPGVAVYAEADMRRHIPADPRTGFVISEIRCYCFVSSASLPAFAMIQAVLIFNTHGTSHVNRYIASKLVVYRAGDASSNEWKQLDEL